MTHRLLAVVDPAVDLAVVRELWVEAGWTVRRGDAPAEPWRLDTERLLLDRRVTDERDVAECVDGAVRGAGVLASVRGGDDVRELLLADLGRVGDVIDVAPVTSPVALLDDDQRTLLGAVAGGATTAEAAAAAFVSTRTAERRLAAARRALGVRTTAEAATIIAGIDFGDVAVIGEYPQLDPSYGRPRPEKERSGER